MSDPRTSVVMCQGKEPQTIVPPTYIQRAEPVMMCTNDARTASLNVLHHHSLQVWELMVGDGWQETRQAHSLLGV